jgi:hypothetical protein
MICNLSLIQLSGVVTLYIVVVHLSKKSEPVYILLSNPQFSGIITSGTIYVIGGAVKY